MKISCICGNHLVDQSDYIPYKAHIIPDQDLFDLFDELDSLLERASELQRPESGSGTQEQPLRELHMRVRQAFSQYTNLLYQCTRCERLYLDDGGGSLYVFAPESNTSEVSLLRSVRGEQWKRPLRGWWNSQSGQGSILDYGSNAEEGFLQFGGWDELEARYFELFDLLRQRDLLRNALLKKDGQVVHQWGPRKD